MASSEPDRAATAELEITAEMIEAGVRVLYASGAIEHPIRENDQSLVSEIFLAMARLRRASQL